MKFKTENNEKPIYIVALGLYSLSKNASMSGISKLR